jgi:hypothetical protein
MQAVKPWPFMQAVKPWTPQRRLKKSDMNQHARPQPSLASSWEQRDAQRSRAQSREKARGAAAEDASKRALGA